MEKKKKMEPVCSKTQFKIQHISRETKKSVITHIFETTRGYHEAVPCI